MLQGVSRRDNSPRCYPSKLKSDETLSSRWIGVSAEDLMGCLGLEIACCRDAHGLEHQQSYLSLTISFDSSAARSARLMYGLPAPDAPLALPLSLSGDIQGGAGTAFRVAAAAA